MLSRGIIKNLLRYFVSSLKTVLAVALWESHTEIQINTTEDFNPAVAA